jgi:hypothetical protein
MEQGLITRGSGSETQTQPFREHNLYDINTPITIEAPE